jgi:hypothetical protein
MKTKFYVAFVAAITIAAACATTTRDLSGMTFSQQSLTGKFIWHDLITEDVAAAADFYQSIAGHEAETIARRGAHPAEIADVRRNKCVI